MTLGIFVGTHGRQDTGVPTPKVLITLQCFYRGKSVCPAAECRVGLAVGKLEPVTVFDQHLAAPRTHNFRVAESAQSVSMQIGDVPRGRHRGRVSLERAANRGC